MLSNQGTKRKSGEDSTTREKKKKKVDFARNIAVQSGSSKEGTGHGVIKGMRHLPSALDVEKFAEARVFEIDAMEKAIKNASGASTHRAWQTLPRHLRRRAASHDVRRVPGRLREKAKAEMDPVRKKLLSRKLPRAGKNKRVTKTNAFAKRQRDKSWLETHVWHAKRMKMVNMWGYRLAVQPTEKSYRPSHRASIQGSILHDASYIATIEIKGPESALVAILELVCDPQGPGPGATRWIVGSRVFNTHLYRAEYYPFHLMGPATIIWRPLDGVAGTSAQSVSGVPQNEKETFAGQVATGQEGKFGRQRMLWLRIHPAIFDDVVSELQKATSQVLDRPRPSTEEITVEIADLRRQVNAFEITGPKSTQVLRGALTPAIKDDREEFKKFWSSLSDVQTSGSIPRGTIIGSTVLDPRLNFPPKNVAITYKEDTRHIFPSTELARSGIWEQDIRKTLTKPRYKKKDLDERRSKGLVPGTPLSPMRQDDRIPILLIQRTLETLGHESQALHGYTLLVPAGWSMAFWSSLTYTGTRVGGQRERQTQAFEAGVPFFPRDFPFSKAYEDWAREREREERERWDRKPPAKRVNFAKLGVRSPWIPDWEVVLGLRGPENAVELAISKGKVNPPKYSSTQRDNVSVGTDKISNEENQYVNTEGHETSMGMAIDDSELRPWLLRGAEVNRVLGMLQLNPAANLLKEINNLRQKRSLGTVNSLIGADDFLRHALINVKVTMFKEGVPEDMAMIYCMLDEEAIAWEQTIVGNRTPGAGVANVLQLANKRPPQENIIGYITTGHYSLSRGEGFALGAVPLTKLLALREQQGRLHPQRSAEKQTLIVKIRNINGQQCRPAHLKIIECGN